MNASLPRFVVGLFPEDYHAAIRWRPGNAAQRSADRVRCPRCADRHRSFAAKPDAMIVVIPKPARQHANLRASFRSASAARLFGMGSLPRTKAAGDMARRSGRQRLSPKKKPPKGGPFQNDQHQWQ
jgi:hypothetical protein